jgi:SNF2 family DNA or RNA helicase
MSHGLTLTKANMIIWYAPVDNLDTYIQANARIVRAGQDKKTVIVHLQGTHAEKRVYRRLQNKQDVQGLLLDMFDGVSEE